MFENPGNVCVQLVPVTLAAALLTVCAMVWPRYQSPAAQVDRQLQEAAAHGYPASINELAATYLPLLPEENGAGLLTGAGEIINNSIQWNGLVLEPPFSSHHLPLDEDMATALRSFVNDYRDCLALSHSAAQRRGLHFSIDLQKGYTLVLPHHEWMQRLVAVHMLAAVAATCDRDPDRAIANIQTATWIIEALEREPTGSVCRLRQTMFQTIWVYLPHVLSRGQWSVDHLTQLHDALMRVRFDKDMLLRAMAIQRVIDATPQLIINSDTADATKYGGATVSEHTVKLTEQWAQAIGIIERTQQNELLNLDIDEFAGISKLHVKSFVLGAAKVQVARAVVAAMREHQSSGRWLTPDEIKPLTLKAQDHRLAVRATLHPTAAVKGSFDMHSPFMEVCIGAND